MLLAPVPLQRLEGAALLVGSVVAFAASDQSWWWFGLLLLAPDLSMVGYLAGPRLGAALYNLGHTMAIPLLVLAWALPTGRAGWLAAAAIWLAHIGMDRALGYGLKHDDGFQHTHLGMIGRR